MKRSHFQINTVSHPCNDHSVFSQLLYHDTNKKFRLMSKNEDIINNFLQNRQIRKKSALFDIFQNFLLENQKMTP